MTTPELGGDTPLKCLSETKQAGYAGTGSAASSRATRPS
jgi:hypothetical protein